MDFHEHGVWCESNEERRSGRTVLQVGVGEPCVLSELVRALLKELCRDARVERLVDRSVPRGCVRVTVQGQAANAVELFAMPDVDGGLVGGASLLADEFVAIWRAAGAR